MTVVPYQLLVGHRRTDGSWKSGQALRMQYLSLTDQLIHAITAGTTMRGVDGERIEGALPTDVVFLDKSARPVAWQVREAWSLLARERPGAAPLPRPRMHFLNIDRNQWLTTVDPSGSGLLRVEHVAPEVLWSLRSVFVEPRFKRGELSETVLSMPALLDAARVLVVDEVYSTGRTTAIASSLLLRAFPTALVGEAHWMGGTVFVRGAIGNADLPVWYRQDTELGRGVGDRLADLIGSRPTANPTQLRGRWFLSSRLPHPDARGLQLRRELQQLIRSPDVPIRPAVLRDDLAERLEWLNGGEPVAAIMRRVREIEAYGPGEGE